MGIRKEWWYSSRIHTKPKDLKAWGSAWSLLSFPAPHHLPPLPRDNNDSILLLKLLKDVFGAATSPPLLFPLVNQEFLRGPCFRVLGMVIQKPWKSAETSIGGTSEALKGNFYHLPLFHKANLKFWETDTFSLLYIVREKMYKFQSLNSPKRIFFPLPLCFLSPWDLLHRLLTKP